MCLSPGAAKDPSLLRRTATLGAPHLAEMWDRAALTSTHISFGVMGHPLLWVVKRTQVAFGTMRYCLLMSVFSQPDSKFMRMAIDLATENVRGCKGGPFGAVIVRDGEVIAAAANTVTTTHDPTAHAEVNAIRAACAKLGSFQLDGCDVYTSCEPCPMCLAALYWARCARIFYGNTAADAAAAGFDDGFLYEELKRPANERRIPCKSLLSTEAFASFEAWRDCVERIDY